MNMYELLVFVHIAAAVALLSGSIIGSPAVRAGVRRARTTQEMRAYLTIGRPLLVLEPVSALVVLLTGVYLTHVANFWSLGWVQAAIALWLVNAAVAGTMVKPAIGRVATESATALDGPVEQPLDALRRSAQWSVGGDLLLANDAAVLYLMAMKPGMADSLLVVAAANGIVAVARAIRPGLRRAGVATERASASAAARPIRPRLPTGGI